ncbi:MAG TPA: hypothetical protein VGO50_20905 [Pyrinomonadaceae bacterium]|nr:hypothetical protein [Pyrinomonadaceae bacterium]
MNITSFPRHRFLQKCSLFLMILGFIISANAQFPAYQKDAYEQSLYKLSGRIVSSNTETSSERVYVNLSIEYELKNTSKINLIFWKRNLPEFDPEPTFTGKMVSKSFYFDNNDILEDIYGGPSDSYAEKYSVLRKSLNQNGPPVQSTMTLRPQESRKFTSEVTLITDRKENKRTHELSFEKLRSISPVWLKTHYEVWSSNIEPKGKRRDIDLTFGKTLRKRWIKYGYLMLKDITSDPIQVMLNSVPSLTAKKE